MQYFKKNKTTFRSGTEKGKKCNGYFVIPESSDVDILKVQILIHSLFDTILAYNKILELTDSVIIIADSLRQHFNYFLHDTDSKLRVFFNQCINI